MRDRQKCYQLHQHGQRAPNEVRTRDLTLTKRMLCQLSYKGTLDGCHFVEAPARVANGVRPLASGRRCLPGVAPSGGRTDSCRLCLRPYYAENTGTRPISEVKQRRAWGVLRWVTTWES